MSNALHLNKAVIGRYQSVLSEEQQLEIVRLLGATGGKLLFAKASTSGVDKD